MRRYIVYSDYIFAPSRSNTPDSRRAPFVKRSCGYISLTAARDRLAVRDIFEHALAVDEMLVPPRAVETIEAHHAASVRRMHETLPANVDADMADISPVREEHEIARLQIVAIESA